MATTEPVGALRGAADGQEPAAQAQEVVREIESLEGDLWAYLNDPARRWRRWLLFDDPVRRKNLEKVHGYLHMFLTVLTGPDGTAKAPLDASLASLRCLLAKLKDPDRLSFDGAWELADQLELTLTRLGEDGYLYALLVRRRGRGEAAPGATAPPPATELADVYTRFTNAAASGVDSPTRLRARRLLEDLLQSEIAEYRRDRAKIRLRGKQLLWMTGVLATLLIAFSLAYAAATQAAQPGVGRVLLLVASAGAAGSVLSRAIKLGRQPLRPETAPAPATGGADGRGPAPGTQDAARGARPEDAAPPLGIRALISAWLVFLAQPVLGAASALIMAVVFQAGLLTVQMPPNAPQYAVVGFVAGFVEPFLTRTLDRLAQTMGGY